MVHLRSKLSSILARLREVKRSAHPDAT
jgi:hypothetical protein